MAEELQNNTELTDDQVNELYDKISSPESNNEETPAVETTTQEEARKWELAEGVNVDENQLLDHAKKGYEYSTKHEPIVEKYQQIDEYAIKNPDWWTHVQDSYGNKDADRGIIESNPSSEGGDPQITELKSQLNEISQFINNQKIKDDQKQTAEEDSLLDAEISSIREKHPYIDFATADDKGMNLERKVLNHANEIGTTSFRAAFRDYAHDQLISKAQELGKEAIGKDLERKTKLGILGTSDKPNVKKASSDSVKGKSYEDLLKEGLAELGI